jgi:hypothetical protein
VWANAHADQRSINAPVCMLSVRRNRVLQAFKERCTMVNLHRSTNYSPVLAQTCTVRSAAQQSERGFALVAVLEADGHGCQRPVLGLRRHQAAQKQYAAPVHQGVIERTHFGQGTAQGAHKSVRPFVLRARLGERIQLEVTNLLDHCLLSLALVDDDYGIMESCGAPPVKNGETGVYTWNCRHAGVYPMYNKACSDPMERRSLLGVLIVEP